jgi:hypothetical protein
MTLETSRLQVIGVTGGPLRITGASLVNGAYELATAGGADYELQTERQVMLDNILFIPGIGFDSDALAYIKAVESADTQALEPAVRKAINSFVVGCKVDGIWDAIKASCILAGARTLNGALVPLKGSAPTNVGPFVSGDYDRKTGLVGNGTTKSLNSNRNNNADPQNNNHNAVWISVGGTGPLLGPSGDFSTNQNSISLTATRNRSNTANLATISTGFVGMSRVIAGSYDRRNGGTTSIVTQSSGVPSSINISLFRFETVFGDHRISFYSIGESLNLALLDARVTTLINTFGAVI